MSYVLLPVILILLVILGVIGINILWHVFIHHQVSEELTLYGEAQMKSLQEHIDDREVRNL